MNKRKLLYELAVIAVGNIILAFAVSFFIIPNDVLAGGVAGIAIAISPLVPFSVETIITVVIVICYILGLIFLGKTFALKTLASSLMYPIFVGFMGALPMELASSIEPLLAAVYGGLISGIGIGIVFRMGSSTGGMDVPPLILAKYTRIKLHSWMIIVDGLTILLGIATYGLNAALTGLISAYILSKTVALVQTFGGEDAKQVFIITDSVDEVINHILVNIDRGATLIQAEGGYTRESKQIIMTVLMPQQYAQLEKAVKEVDKSAFFIVSDVTEVHGHGFYES